MLAPPSQRQIRAIRDRRPPLEGYGEGHLYGIEVRAVGRQEEKPSPRSLRPAKALGAAVRYTRDEIGGIVKRYLTPGSGSGQGNMARDLVSRRKCGVDAKKKGAARPCRLWRRSKSAHSFRAFAARRPRQ